LRCPSCGVKAAVVNKAENAFEKLIQEKKKLPDCPKCGTEVVIEK